MLTSNTQQLILHLTQVTGNFQTKLVKCEIIGEISIALMIDRTNVYLYYSSFVLTFNSHL